MLLQPNNYKKFHICIILVFLATSGFPSFLIFKKFVPLLLPFILFEISKSRIIIPKNVKLAMIVLSIFAVLHLFLGHLTIIGTISFILIMATVMCAGILIGNSFGYTYVMIMKFFSYIAVTIWLLLLIIPNIHTILISIGSWLPQMVTDEWLENTTNNGVSLYLYYLPLKVSTSYTDFIRNCGPFYEPGLFASYLVIALFLNFCQNNKLVQKKNLILIAAILTTCSSAGYVSLALLVLYSAFFSKSHWSKIVTIIAIVILWQPMMNLDFMSGKISANFEDTKSSSASRFGAMIYHAEKIEESPILGFAGGTLPLTEFDRFLGQTNSEKILSPNGLTYAFVYWGIPFAIIFYILLFRGLKKLLPRDIKKCEMWFAYVIILSTAFSQNVTTETVVLLISSLAITYKYEN